MYEIFHNTVKAIEGKDFFPHFFKRPFKFQANFYQGMLLGFYVCTYKFELFTVCV